MRLAEFCSRRRDLKNKTQRQLKDNEANYRIIACLLTCPHCALSVLIKAGLSLQPPQLARLQGRGFWGLLLRSQVLCNYDTERMSEQVEEEEEACAFPGRQVTSLTTYVNGRC